MITQFKIFENRSVISYKDFTDTSKYWVYTYKTKDRAIIHCLEKMGFEFYKFQYYYFASGNIEIKEIGEYTIDSILTSEQIELRPATEEEIELVEMAMNAKNYNL